MKNSHLLIAVTISCLIGNVHAQSPNWLWAKAMAGTDDQGGYSIVIDSSGNIYTMGWLEGTCDFDPGPGVFNLTSVGQGDVFVSKSDSSGNYLWAKSFGGSGNDACFSIAVDGNGDVYTTGYFSGTVDFDPGAGIFNLTAVAVRSAFVSRLDSTGNFIWAKAIGGNSQSVSIVLSPSNGDMYITGSFSGTSDFNPDAGIFNLTAVAGGDIFILKLSNAGNFVWAKAMTGALSSFNYGYSIALDISGNIYITGFFRGTGDFDPGAGVYNLISAGQIDIFISKLDSSGGFIWAKAFGGNDIDDSHFIALDHSGSGAVYTTGRFRNTVDFDPGAGVYNLTATGSDDAFISKLDTAGNFVWANRIGGTINTRGHSIALDRSGSGDVYITGYYEGTTDFNPGPGIYNLTSAGTEDIYILKLDNAGGFAWVKSVGGTQWDQGYSIALSHSGNVIVAGSFYSPTISFGPSTLTNAGAFDIFIAKLDTLTIATGNNEMEWIGKGAFVFPNPASTHFSIALEGYNKKVEVTITDMAGKVIFTTTATETQKIDVSTNDFGEGVYVVRIQTDGFIEIRKLIITK